MADEIPAWKKQAQAEIASVKEHFINLHGWVITSEEALERITLFVRLRHTNHPERIRVLKLEYGPEFPQVRPREGFVDPNDYQKDGLEFWIDDSQQKQAFKREHNPPVICLEGTWGFHSVLHKERDPMRASLNKLLLEIQQCFDLTP